MAKLDYQTELSHLNNVWCLKNYQPKMIRTKVNSRGSLLDVSDPAELLIAKNPNTVQQNTVLQTEILN